MNGKMKLSFFGAAGTVTGSCFLVNTGVGKVMIDCGMFQGPSEIEQRNYLGFGFDPSDVDYLLLTHAHIDHIGLVPRLVKFGFNGSIYCTRATRDLAEILLLDSAHIQKRDAEYALKRNVDLDRVQSFPLYTAEDVIAAMRRFRPVEYEEPVNLSRNLTVRFRDAGHIIGSASIELTVKTAEGGARLVASGDVGLAQSAILKDPRPFEQADYLLLESTYGDRDHDRKGDKKTLLTEAIEHMLERNGPLIIPSFAVGRTQQILYNLSKLRSENPHWPRFPVFVDSPLATKATQIVNRHPECFDRELAAMLDMGKNPFMADGLQFTNSVEESKDLNFLKGPRIVISASGMCTAGRIRHHLANHLSDPDATVLFVGFQAHGTLGRILIEKAKSVKLFGERIPVRARIAKINGFSAHAGQTGLINWVSEMRERPVRIFVVHGEPRSSNALASLLDERGYDASVAIEDQTVELPLVHPVHTPETAAPLAERVGALSARTEAVPAPPPEVSTPFNLPTPVHPGDSARNRVSRYLRWLEKELGDAGFVVDEIESEMQGWLASPNLPLTPAQSIGVVYDDILAGILPLLTKILSGYENQLSSSDSNDESAGATGEIARLKARLEEIVTDSRKRILEKLDAG